MNGDLRIAVVGGAGHVGLPLSLVLAKNGFQVVSIDQDHAKVQRLSRGEFLFLEKGGPELLNELNGKSIEFSADHSRVREARAIILTVGTPVDEHMNPSLSQVFQVMDQIRPHLTDGQVLILRSTVFPGTSEKIQSMLESEGIHVSLSFCPERIAQGNAIAELQEFPQIISGSDQNAIETARFIFSRIANEVIELPVMEAELAKLFTNAWRYIQFAVSNQFYITATEKGLDFYRIRDAMMRNYPRAAAFPTAGFTAGPCLFKDTMQIAAYNRQNFALGHAAMLVNETLPDFLIDQLKREQQLAGVKVGILGMAYKADNDDPRESLAYKLRRLLQYEKAIVFCTDPYIRDPNFYSLETVLKEAKVLFIGCPHSEYRVLDYTGRKVIDCWGITRKKRN